MDPSLDLAQFDMSPGYGFLPSQPPASSLPASHAVYESLIREPPLHEAIQSHQLRDKVGAMPMLAVDSLNAGHKQRAYVILSFVAHGYIWGNGTAILSELPPQLSRPLAELSEELGLRPLGTYASTVLWNCWSDIPPAEWGPENISVGLTFTGSKEEEAFYAISAAVEAHGGASLSSILRILGSAQHISEDPAKLLADFEDVRLSLRKMVDDMKWIDDTKINPYRFFWKMRPYFAGWDAVQPAGVRYMHCEAPRTRYRGISAAQSSLFAALDIFFGIDHQVDYLKEMRMHMPLGHRMFLSRLEEVRGQRGVMLEQMFASDAIRPQMQQCRKLLAAFREVHLRLAKKYAVEQASLKHDVSFGLAKPPEEGGGVLGAGGTKLVPFLSSMISKTKG